MVTKVTNAVFDGVSTPIDEILLATPLVVGSGGTGLATIPHGDLIVGSGNTTSLTTVDPGTSGNVLVSNGSGVVPSFQNLSLASIGGVVTVPHGGTGLNAIAAGAVMVGEGTSAVGQSPPGAAGFPLVSAGTGQTPVFGPLDPTVAINGAVPVVNGGTGDISLNAHAVLIGAGTSPVAFAAPGTAGRPLVSAGASANPLFSDTMTIGTINVTNLVIGGDPYNPNPFTLINADITFYISPTGNDSTGTGLIGAPWLTLQHAYNYIVGNTICLGNHQVTIQMADGTYPNGLVANSAPIGGITINITGNTGSPQNVIVSVIGDTCFQSLNTASLRIRGVTMIATEVSNVGGVGVLAAQGGILYYGDVIFGTCDFCHIFATANGTAIAELNYQISGGSQSHWESSASGFLQASGVHTAISVQLNGVYNFSNAFAISSDAAAIYAPNNTFSGTATGERYLVLINGIIDTQGAGESYFPGNASGVAELQGLYL